MMSRLTDLEQKIDNRGVRSTVITENGINKIEPSTYDGQTSWTTYQLQFEAAAIT